MFEIPDKPKIVLYGPRVAHVESDPVWPEEYYLLPKLRSYMLGVMRIFNGVGLAAPQVGIFKQYAVFELVGGKAVDIVNPEITRMYGKEIVGFEACLSIPPGGNGCLVARQESIRVNYRTTDDPYHEKSGDFYGRDAVVAQHEIDHMTGTFFIDRTSIAERRRVLEEYHKYRKEKFPHAEVNPRPQPAPVYSNRLSSVW